MPRFPTETPNSYSILLSHGAEWQMALLTLEHRVQIRRALEDLAELAALEPIRRRLNAPDEPDLPMTFRVQSFDVKYKVDVRLRELHVLSLEQIPSSGG